MLTSEFTWEDYGRLYGERALPLFVVDGGKLIVLTAIDRPRPKVGQTVIAAVEPNGVGAKERKASSGDAS